MISRTLECKADGRTFHSELFRLEENERGPGILVFPDIMGLGPHAKERAMALAELGYIVLACDYHGEGKILPFDEAMDELKKFSRDVYTPRARARGNLDALLQQPGVDPSRVGAMGFCYGGTLALELARSGASLAAVVGLHCGLASAGLKDAQNIRAKVLVCIGADDPYVPSEQRTGFESEMRSAKIDWQLHVYGGVVHTFTDWRCDALNMPQHARYDAKADARSSEAMLGLFREAFA